MHRAPTYKPWMPASAGMTKRGIVRLYRFSIHAGYSKKKNVLGKKGENNGDHHGADGDMGEGQQ